jgi:hypothetical protein
MNIKKRLGVLLSTFVILLMAASPALAASPHFINTSASVDNAGNLVVSWKEAGLGDNQLISYTVSADASATYYCLNGGGKHPQAANKETVNGPVSGSGTFSSGKNGQITASLTVSPPGPGDFSCPPGQRLVLGDVTYMNITLTDITNGISVFLGTISRIFIQF